VPQDLPDDGGVRDVAHELIELAGGEQAARRHQYLTEFLHDRGLADTRISGDKNEFRHAGGDNMLECAEQRGYLLSASL
jgi:hypothetical protein